MKKGRNARVENINIFFSVSVDMSAIQKLRWSSGDTGGGVERSDDGGIILWW
jgi:hypothetical protein